MTKIDESREAFEKEYPPSKPYIFSDGDYVVNAADDDLPAWQAVIAYNNLWRVWQRAWSARDGHGAAVGAHPDDIAVDQMAAVMKAKLAKKREQGRGGWEDKTRCTAERLSKMLIDHIAKGDPIDVANFAMMLHQRGEWIITQPSADSRRGDAVRNAAVALMKRWPTNQHEGAPLKDEADALRLALESDASAAEKPEPFGWAHKDCKLGEGNNTRAVIACEKIDDFTVPLYRNADAVEKSEPTAYLYTIRGGHVHQTVQFASMSDDDNCWRDRDDGAYELLGVIPLYEHEAPRGADALHDLIYDGYSVYSALSDKAKQRTSADNVSDVLDALAKISGQGG